jgi:hypothetical protein
MPVVLFNFAMSLLNDLLSEDVGTRNAAIGVILFLVLVAILIILILIFAGSLI